MSRAKLYRAWIDTWNYAFEAYGESESEARDALKRALLGHAIQCECSSAWIASVAKEANKMLAECGVGYRDSEMITAIADKSSQGDVPCTVSYKISDLKECLREFVDLVDSAGGPVKLAHHGAELGQTVYAVKLSDAVARAKEYLS